MKGKSFMDEPKIHEIKQWILKADHDFVSAERLLAGDPPLRDTAVYHCQQAAEKILKAYLTLRDAPFQKVHTLSVLIDQCEKLDQSFQQIRASADILTPYATAFRYPGDLLEPEPADADEALLLAREVIDFVTAKMPADLGS